MASPSQIEDSAQSRALIESQLRECYGRATYSHKTHEKCADILLARLGSIKFWQIVLSAMTTCGFIFAIFDSLRVLGVAGALISTTLLVLNSYTKDYDLGTVAQRHKQAANELWLIRERYLSLITDLLINRKPLEEVVEERDRLTKDLSEVYASAPSTSGRAYKQAQQALKYNEDMTFSENELDALLPAGLRRNGRG